MRRMLFLASLALAAVAALAVIGAAGGAAAKKGKPALSATPVFKAMLKPSQEVPRVTDLRANAVGNVTFDLTRDTAGAITAGEVIFYFNYKFPGAVTISGLHVHEGKKGTNGPIVIDSAVGTVADSDGVGNVTTVRTATPTELAEIADILKTPRDYYVNLHTTVPNHPGGAIRAQLHNPKKR
jgi:hypothetical protein